MAELATAQIPVIMDKFPQVRVESWDDRTCSFLLVEWSYGVQVDNLGIRFCTSHPELYPAKKKLRLKIRPEGLPESWYSRENGHLLTEAFVTQTTEADGKQWVQVNWQKVS